MRLQNRGMILLLLVMVLFVTTVSISAAALESDANLPDLPTADGTISFNVNDTTTTIDQRVLGTNLPARLGPGRSENNTFISRTNAANPAVIRIPGGSWSNGYDWSACENYGSYCSWALRPTDFINFLQANGAEGMYTINMNGTSKEAAAAVAFFNGSVSDTTVIGTDVRGNDWKTVGYWAQLRSDHGNPNPINIKYWEIGNEIYGGKSGSGKDCLDWGWEDVWTCDGVEYVNGIGSGGNRNEGFIEFRNAMRAVDPTIMVGAVGIPWGNSPDFWINYNNWGNEVIENAGSVMDFYVIHQYAYTDPPASRQDALAQPQSTWQPLMADLEASFDQYASGRRVPIAVTEYNLFAVEDKDTGQWMTQAVNMLFMADTIGQMMGNGFAIANQWDLANGQAWNGTDYGLLDADNDARSPQYYV
ncbi:MAG: alpha-L-arabinofuranosidase, partial [Anaerolineae bacterium]